ncbi:hypothetical protein ACFLVX_04380 [Chloroflexota bacterium]
MPNQFLSDRQYHRFWHFDLPKLTDEELTDELYYLRPILWGLKNNHWLRVRVEMIEEEITWRQGDTRREFRQRAKPKPAEGVKL